MSEVLLKHLDATLTAVVPLLVAALAAWLRVKTQQKYVREVVERTEAESATTTDPTIENHIKHEHAARLTMKLPAHVRPVLPFERDLLIKSSVKNMKQARASMAPKEPKP